MLLGPAPLGDVARDLRRADYPAVAVLDRRYRQGNVDQAAVLAPAHGLEMLDALATPDPPQDLRFLVQPLLRQQDGDRPAARLVLREAEQPLGTGVPTHDRAVQVLRQDGVLGRLDKRSESRLVGNEGFR